MLKKVLFLLFYCLFITEGKGQNFVVKTNLAEIGTTTLNLAGEMNLSEHYSLNLSGSFNPWTFSGNKKYQHWVIRPEIRYWTQDVFSGHFFGFHAFHGRFNTGGISLLGLKDERREGNFTGAGFSYGYVWRLAEHWNLETTLGLGYAYQDYKRFNCGKCGKYLGKAHKNYVGPTQVGINLIYAF